MKNPNRDISLIEKKIEILKNTKTKGLNVTSLKELEEKNKEARKEEIIFAIQSFLIAKRNGRGNISSISQAVNLSRQTFSKYASYYEVNQALPRSKNIGRVPWNKTTDSTMLKVVNISSQIIDKVNKFAKEPVPTLMPLLYKKVMEEMNRKYASIKISKSTYKRILESNEVKPLLKFETKIHRKLRRKLERLNIKLKELKLIKAKTNANFEFKSIKNKILSDGKIEEGKNYSISKRRTEAKPGSIVQWDGSIDQFKNRSVITRMQTIDHNSLATMALSFVKNENNNGFQMLISQLINNYGIPSIILGDKRKGVDPTDEGALHSIICKLLGISLNLDSNSIHKAEIEALNGKMHPYITYHCALNNINSLKKLNEESQTIIRESNNYFKRAKSDFSHLRQASSEVKKILEGKITQVYIKSSDGVIFKKSAYKATEKNEVIQLERNTWAILSLEKGVPKKIWTDKGIFSLSKITNELSYKIKIDDLRFNEADKHFADNGVMIMNKETYSLLFNKILSIGEKNAIRNRSWRLDQQILEKIKRKQEI